MEVLRQGCPSYLCYHIYTLGALGSEMSTYDSSEMSTYDSLDVDGFIVCEAI